jgi:hypothetical protein
MKSIRQTLLNNNSPAPQTTSTKMSVYQHWDPLRAIAVGQSYPPELYDYIKNEKVRKVFYQIAEETEEDYQKLISILTKFNVDVVRPTVNGAIERAKHAIKHNNQIMRPAFMQPRDMSIMIGETFYCPDTPALKPIVNYAKSKGNTVLDQSELKIGQWKHADFPAYMNGAMTTRVGKDLYIGTLGDPNLEIHGSLDELQDKMQLKFPDYRVTVVDTRGHADGAYCPVKPGLIVSISGEWAYKKTFPDWEVVYLPGESWGKVSEFLHLKRFNNGKWWVPGQELNEDFTNFVETWMNHWVGYVEESVFDVNMLVLDQHNVIVNGYNEKVFDAFSRHGITPHICNFRHRYFWDGGLHCITSDLHREGVMVDYFPERNIIV